ncbi:MAG: hypothetical protein FWG38_05095 [Defluviitaleaceae bacterium]|nr:hypothetical protein [Defluviitaleaceae bacterium]
MIAKMKFISISGHVNSMDHVIDRYLSRYDIQLEPAAGRHLMTPFTTLNPYHGSMSKAARLAEVVGKPPFIHFPMTDAAAVNMVEAAYQAYQQQDKTLHSLETNLAATQTYISLLQNFLTIQLNLRELEQFEYTHYRFGKLPLAHFLQYEKFLADDKKILFYSAKRDKHFVWGVYFTPIKHRETTDAVFASLKFEPLAITSTCIDQSVAGTPQQLIVYWQEQCQRMKAEATGSMHHIITGVVNPKTLAIACQKVRALYASFDLKKFAVISPGNQIFSFSGWLPAKDAAVLETEADSDGLTIVSYQTPAPAGEGHGHLPTPPTLLKNPPILRPFEFFTALYGLPSHTDIDPTPFLAVTYTILFGLMFGDVGHGLVLALAGLLLWYKRKTALGAIIALAGASAVFFGFLYGSIFGFEDTVPALWRRPAQDIAGTLMFAVGLGAALIVLSMGLNMYNAFKRRNISQLLFGPNGAAGFIFYSAMVLIALRVFVFSLPVNGLVVAITIFPLVFVALKHPIERYMAGHSAWPTPGLGQFIFNTVIELFETLLAYITNTISFVRIGAFAISHAGMMHIVLQLSQGATGQRNWVVLILGNALVLVIEGLLVGIQVLRLDFYELFSRFYTGGGRAFAPQAKAYHTEEEIQCTWE